jgi:hypothetical protein
LIEVLKLLQHAYLLPKPPAPPALHTTSLLTTGGVVLLLKGFLLLATLAPTEAFNIILLLKQRNIEVPSSW